MDLDPWTEGANRNRAVNSDIDLLRERAVPQYHVRGEGSPLRERGLREMLKLILCPPQRVGGWGVGGNRTGREHENIWGIWGNSH